MDFYLPLNFQPSERMTVAHSKFQNSAKEMTVAIA